jgi:DNA-binding CsgD family transcriptional regulator
MEKKYNKSVSFKEFKNSPFEYRPVAFLFLNHQLFKEELKWQISQIKKQGLRGFFMHPRDGLLTPYMSKSFRDIVKYIVSQAKKNGIESWLYDEDPYPSGAAGGRVIYEHPEYRSRTLSITEGRFHGGSTIKMDIPMGKFISAFAIQTNSNWEIFPEAKIIDITETIGPLRNKWSFFRKYNTYYISMPKDTYPHWRSETANIHGQIYWESPKGTWQIIAFVEKEEKTWGPWGGYVDLLNSKAVDDFISKTHDIYKKDLKQFFGNTIPGIFTDEPKWIGFLPWTSDFLNTFYKTKKYDLRLQLHALVYNTTKNIEQIRYDYWDVLTSLLKKSFFDKIHNWCEKNNLQFTGHVSPEEEPVYGVFYLGDLMKLAKSFHIPGTDIITSRIGTSEFPIINIGPKLISSVAHQQGKKRVIAEAFALADWDFNFQTMKSITDYLSVLGVNFIVPHGFYYSIDGLRKKEACPSQFYQTTYWEYYHFFSKYIGRLEYILTRGNPDTEFAVLYPTSSLWRCLPGNKQDAEKIGNSFVFLVDTLLRIHKEFDFLDDISLLDTKIHNGMIKIGKQKYTSIIIPPIISLIPEIVKKLEEFISGGGKILFMGPTPKFLSSIYNPLKNENIKFIECPVDILSLDKKDKEFLKAEITKSLKFFTYSESEIHIEGKECSEVFLHKRKTEDGKKIYFLANIGKQTANLDIHIDKNRSWEIWDAFNGEKKQLPVLSSNIFSLSLSEFQSLCMISSKKSQSKISNLFLLKEKTLLKELSSIWNFKIEKDNVLFLGKWQILKGKPEDILTLESSQVIENPVIEPCTISNSNINLCYPSTICYKLNFFVKGNIDRIALVWELSGIKGKYRIFIDKTEIKKEEIKNIRKYDCFNLSYDISKHLKMTKSFYTPSLHTIFVFIDIIEPDDGLTEPIRLFGNFLVDNIGDKGMGSVIKEKKEYNNIFSGSWTDYGYPFYSGTASYEQTFILNYEKNKRYWLKCHDIKDILEIELNGKILSVLLWPPYESEITKFIKNGKNNLKLKVTNSIYNMLEGIPKPSGLFGSVTINIM